MAEPQEIRQYQTSIPQELAPYAQQLLGQYAATMYNYATDEQGNLIKDETNMPVVTGLRQYQPYQGERQAQFTPLQQQAFGAAGNLGNDPYSQAAAGGLYGLAQAAGNYGYQPSQYGNQYNAPSPYQGGCRWPRASR